MLDTNSIHDASSSPVLSRLIDYVDRFAVRTPESVAVVSQGDRLTYASLKEQIDTCAKALLAAGVRKGDRVAMLCTPRTEFWVTFLAASGIGAIWVGLNPRYQHSELEHVVGDCEPTVLIALSNFEGRSYCEDLNVLKVRFPCIRHLVWIGTAPDDGPDALAWDDFLIKAKEVEEKDFRLASESVEPDDPAMIVYTSGTTGASKGAMLSHWSLTYGSTIQTDNFHVENPGIVVSFPINHVSAVADTCATTLVKGGKLVFQERFDPIATLDAIEKERITIWAGVPTMFLLQLGVPDFDTYDLSSVKLILWGGAAMPRDGISRLLQLGARLMTVYGMTETSCNVTYSDPGAGIDELAETVGRPDRRCPCTVVDKRGHECATGEVGELQFKGNFLMLGYWKRPEATAEAFTDDGWLRSGDLGYVRKDGNIILKGRRSEMYKSGGYNIYPREVEIVLEELSRVTAAAVIGVPDDLYQEVGHAYILLKPDQKLSETEVREYCKDRLAIYKVPKRFFLRQSLPLLPVGKVDKQALRQSLVDDEQTGNKK